MKSGGLLIKTFAQLCLFIFSNRVARDGALHLSEVLKQNSTLEFVDLTSNRIEDEGCVHLSEAVAPERGRHLSRLRSERVSQASSKQIISADVCFDPGNNLKDPAGLYWTFL